MTIKTIRAQSLHQGDTIVFGNGQKRTLLSRQKGGQPRRKTSRGQVIGLEMFYQTSNPGRLPGVYHPRTGVHYASIEAAKAAGETVVRPECWVRYERSPIRTVVFAWDQPVRVQRSR